MFRVKRDALILIEDLGQVLIDVVHNQKYSCGLFLTMNLWNDYIY